MHQTSIVVMVWGVCAARSVLYGAFCREGGGWWGASDAVVLGEGCEVVVVGCVVVAWPRRVV